LIGRAEQANGVDLGCFLFAFFELVTEMRVRRLMEIKMPWAKKSMRKP